MSDQPDVPVADPGESPTPPSDPPTEAFSDAELAELIGRVDDPTDPAVLAGLAGNLYDPDYTGPGGDTDGDPS